MSKLEQIYVFAPSHPPGSYLYTDRANPADLPSIASGWHLRKIVAGGLQELGALPNRDRLESDIEKHGYHLAGARLVQVRVVDW